ncbi:lysophospholipid acyltransferase family protein [Plastoroseomonas arctica]|uniref:1-acyl-sn-glycerol-3-phosphate acyltransferase n=1 Tax=Plastoroseomonas arctica TaxID=1509237 RepID=A0AAF1JYS0_9PROT|nr:lysophospholipid acyltransferase family protein [Plastoroseomonas arctica]MBR0655133.1 1-acyl-sn-glycerol-3-phosphate acyltransferase [Plastoroseomonas arctica]
MTYLRSVVFNLFFFPFTALICLFGQPLRLGRPHWTRLYVRYWAMGAMAIVRIVCGIRIRIEGRENLPDGGFILAAKHQSAFDTMIWLMVLRQPCYVLKQELLDLPLWGGLARHSGIIAVDRGAGASALRGLVKQGREVLAEGRAVVIFPEGTRTLPGERVAYQPGVAALATATGAIVVPAATDSGRLWGRRAFWKTPGTITVSILPPLPAGLRREAMMTMMENVIETRTAELFEMSGHATPNSTHRQEKRPAPAA